MKAAVDTRAPSKFTHIRHKNYKEQFFRKREHLNDNNILVSKILNARVLSSHSPLYFIVQLPWDAVTDRWRQDSDEASE